MNDKRQVSKERGEKLAIEYGMKCLETSAKLNENIENAFFTLAKDIKAKTEKRLVKIFVMKTLTRNILYKIFFFYLRTKIDRRLVQTTLVLIK